MGFNLLFKGLNFIETTYQAGLEMKHG